MTSRDAGQIPVASNGDVNIAPLGTALPTDVSAPLDAAFRQLGYISEDGVTVSNSVDSEGLPAWQSSQPVRTLVTGSEVTSSFELMQWNDVTLPFAFGGGTFVDNGNGTWSYPLPMPEERTEFACVIDAFDGTRAYRIVFPRVTVSDLGDISFTRSDAAVLPVTITANPDDSGRAGYLYGNDGTGGAGNPLDRGGDYADATTMADLATLKADADYGDTGTAAPYNGGVGTDPAFAAGEFIYLNDASQAHWDGDSWEAGSAT